MVHSSYFIGGYAIHGYVDVPPYAASHGCLRVPIPSAWSIFTWVRMYTKFCNSPPAKVAICPNVGWLKDFSDAQTYLDPTFNGANILQTGNSNWSQLNDPELNKMMDDAKTITDRKSVV